MEFIHKGIKIVTTNEGRFKATLAGKPVETPSLDAMKGRIDKQDKAAFEPFDIIRVEQKDRSSDESKWVIKKDRVIGFTVTGRKTRYSEQEYSFKVADSDDNYRYSNRRVILATPTNLKVAEELAAHQNETVRIERERKKQREAIEKAFEYRICPQER